MKLKLNVFSALVIAIIFCGTIFQNAAVFKTGVVGNFRAGKEGVGYWGPLARDGVWHEALVASLKKGFPAENPGFAGERLTNYHYLYDALVAVTTNFGFSAQFLIYRFYPILFSILLGIGVVLVTLRLFQDKLTSLIALYLAYFASSLGWIVDLVKGREIGGESAFWANQPVSMNLNPPFAISLVILLFLILTLDSYLKNPKNRTAILFVVLAGLLVGFKAYAGAVVLSALAIFAIFQYLKNNTSNFVILFAASSFLAFVIYLPQADFTHSLINFSPLWLINTMIDAGDRVGIPNFTTRRFAYIDQSKWIHLSVLQFISISLFIVGNLGTRVMGFTVPFRKLIKEKIHSFIFLVMIASLIPPFIFIQAGNPWNIVQFFYYFIFLFSFYAAFAVSNIFTRLKIPASYIFLALFLVLTPISSIATWKGWLYPNPPAYLPTEELEALSFLKRQPSGIVFKKPFDRYERDKFKDPYPLAVYADSTYVSAYSGKSIYLEDVEQQIILATDYKPRLMASLKFFEEKDAKLANNFLSENKISYVYLPKIFYLPIAEREYNMDKIFENEAVNIYRVRN